MIKWDKKYINDLIREFEQKKKGTYFIGEINSYDRTIESLKNLLHNGSYIASNSYSILKYRKFVKDDLSILERYGQYAPYVRVLGDELLKVKVSPIPFLEKVSTKDAIKVTRSFYSMVGGFYFEQYMKLESNFKKSLNLRRITRYEEAFGYTYPIANTDLVFFDIGVNGTLQDYITFIHELSHGITCSNNINVMQDNEKYCLQEADSLFFELLGIDFIGNEKNKKEALLIHLSNLKEYIISAAIIACKMDMYSILSSKEVMSIRKASNFVNCNIRDTNIAIDDVLLSKMSSSYHYVISFLTAIELYELYYVDKDTALSKVKQIQLSKNLTAKGYLNLLSKLQIKLGSHLDDFIRRLNNLDTELNDEKILYYKN